MAPPEFLLTAAKPHIVLGEDDRLHVYYDTEHIPTIGVGINLLVHDVRALCQKCGADYTALLAGTADLTPEQSNFLYEQKAIQTIEWLSRLFPAYFTYSLPRQIALLDMGYNLGEPRFRGFRKMISAILQGDWAEASKQAEKSEWDREVGARATRDADALANG